MEKVYLENGHYAISYYYNDKDEKVDKENATNCIICEFDSNNKLIKEARFVIKQQEKNEEDYGIREYDNSDFPIIKR